MFSTSEATLAATTSSQAPSARGKKRERSEVSDDTYLKNKRILQEGFRSLSIVPESLSQVPSSPSRQISPTYKVYSVHNNCPSHDLFRSDSLESTCSCGQNTAENNPRPVAGPEPPPGLGSSRDRRFSISSSPSSDGYSDEDDDPMHAAQREMFVSMVKGGKRKYVRKVDYLVDELIRKTRKTKEVPLYLNDLDAAIPANIGPSPRTDQALSILVPFSTDFCSLSRSQHAVINEVHGSHSLRMGANSTTHTDTIETDMQPILLSGEITHSDWGMEEVAQKSSPTNQNYYPMTRGDSVTALNPQESYTSSDVSVDNDSDMACCDESSKKYSSNNSLQSGHSGMLVDDSSDADEYDDDLFGASSCRSIAFDENSSMAGRCDLSRLSPWSACTSVKTVMTRNAATDDEEDDVINVGTF